MTEEQASDRVAKLEAKVRRLELALDIGKKFSSTLEVDKLMATILDSVVGALDAEACSFWIKEKSGKELSCRVAVGPSAKKVIGTRLKVGSGLVGWVVSHKEKVVLFDASKDERFNRDADKKSGFITKSMLAVPLVVNDECMGAVQLLNKKTHHGQFDQNDLEMLELLAVNAAISIKNALLYQSEKRIRELNHLLELSKEITSTLDLDRVLLSIVNLGAKVIFYERALIGLLDIQGKLSLAAESHVAMVDRYIPENQQITAIMREVVESGKPLHVTNYRSDRPPKEISAAVRDYMDSLELHSLSVIPLHDAEGKLGVISMEGKYGALTSQESGYVLDMIVNQATVAIRNAQLYTNIPKGGLVGKLSEAVKREKWSMKQAALVGGGVTVALALLLSLQVPHRYTVDLEVVPQRNSPVSSRLDGVVKEIHVTGGSMVEEGDLLLELDPAPLALERAKLRTDHQIALANLRRWQSEEAASEAHLERLNLEKLESELALVEKKLANTRVVAPASGRLLTRRPEELLKKQIILGESLAEIAVGDEKRLKVFLDESASLAARAGNSVNFTLNALPDRLFSGTLTFISPSPGEKGYEAYLESGELEESELVRFGMTGVAKVDVGKKSLYAIYLKKWKERAVTWCKLMIGSG